MSLTIAPSTSYEATLELGISGLVGTLKLGTYDGDTATQALATTGINEIGTSGIYVGTRTSPATAGQYVLIWSQDGTLDPDQVSTEDLTVSYTAATVASGSLYLTAAELKNSLGLPGTTFVDDDIDRALNAACRTIDAYKSTRFYPTSETRYYTPDCYATQVDTDDIVSVTTLTVDADGDRSYSEEWTESTHFELGPANAAADGAPYKRVMLISTGGKSFPSTERSVKIVGSFGWADAPWQVVQATEILARRFVSRRTTPYGILIAGTEAVAAARLGRIDPDVAELLDNLPGEQRPRSVSVKLS